MISGSISGDEAFIARLRVLAPKAFQALNNEVERLTYKLVGFIKTSKLSGQVLNRRSGRLSRSVNAAFSRTEAEIKGSAGTNVAYAKPHEYGFHGTVNVREHLRLQKMAWGRELKEPKHVTVRSHSMKMNLPEKSFLRSALADMKPEIRERITAVLNQVVKP